MGSSTLTHSSLTIGSAYDAFRTIYALADRMTMPGGHIERSAFLHLAWKELATCIRKKKSELYPIAVAQYAAWFFCLCESIFAEEGARHVAEGMCKKYPADRCGYCNALPCVCTAEARPEHRSGTASHDQMHWSVTKWQDHLARLYGEQNRRRGIDDALIRAVMEIAEISSIIMRAEHLDRRPHEIASEFAKEASDIFAWLLSLCELLGISLEDAIINTYGQGCPVCSEGVCACRAHEPFLIENGKSYRFMSTEEIATRLKRPE